MSAENRPSGNEQDYFLRNSNGGVFSLKDFMRERSEQGSLMHVGSLRSGDELIFTQEDNSRRLVFQVERAEWRGLSISLTPHFVLSGVLQGSDVQTEFIDKPVEFRGSIFGNSLAPNIVSSDNPPAFALPGGREFSPSGFGYLETVRDGQALSPNQLDRQARNEGVTHSERLRQVTDLTSLLGYDITDFEGDEREYGQPPIYQDKRYAIVYSTGKSQGNQLTAYDRKTGQWIQCKYLHWQGEDILQIGVAQVSRQEAAAVFKDNLLEASNNIMYAGKAMSTFSTSNRYDLDVTNYFPSTHDADSYLGIPRPDIQIFPGGEVHVIHKSVNKEVFQEDPGLEESVRSAVTYRERRGNKILILREKEIILQDPSLLVGKLMEYISAKRSQS